MAVYDRMVEYLEPGDYVKFTSPFGESKWLVIDSYESVGQVKVQFVDDANFIVARADRGGAGLPVPPPAVSDPDLVAMEFLEPQREDRFFQIRPNIIVLDRQVQGTLRAEDEICPLVMLEWDFPVGRRMGGSDLVQGVVTMNTNSPGGGVPNPTMGGPNGGRIPANQIFTRSDLNEMFDLFVFYKTFPSFRVINWSRGEMGNFASGNQGDWYLAFQGRKYVFHMATELESQKLDKRELPYRAIPSPGGVPDTLHRRD